MQAEIGRKILVFLLSILIFIGFPIILILGAPLFLFRFVVAKLAPYLKPELGKILTTRGCIFAAEDYTNFANSNVITAIILEGQVDLETAINSSEQRLLEAQLPNGEVRYPELKQYVTTWAGYYFWKDDKKFDIKNHLKIYQSQKKFTDDDLQELRQNMLQEPWAKNRSPWDITFIPDCYPTGLKSPGPHTALILRFHHVLGDGISWVSLLVQQFGQSEIKFPVPNYPKRSFCGNILDQITFPFRASYNLADSFTISFLGNVPFGLKNGMAIGKYNTSVTDIIPLKKIKAIKTHFNVCFSSVVSAAVAGAIRDLLISKRMEIPSVLRVIAAQPLPRHSLKLRNYVTGVTLKFLIGENDPVKRLKYSDTNYKSLKYSVQPRLFQYGMMLMGSCFSWIIKSVGSIYSVTACISNLPGPSTRSYHFNGHEGIDFMFASGLRPGTNGLMFCALSFVDGFRISSTAASGVLSTTEVNELSALIVKHMDILHERIITDV